jgi:hypothetical protein
MVLGYVLSNVIVLECVDRALQTNDKVLSRATSVAVLAAFFMLGFYDTNLGYDDDGIVGTSFNSVDFVSIVVLLVGMEVYGRTPEPDVEAITQFTHSSK